MKSLAKISNHAYKNSEKNQIIFIDNLIINPQFIGSPQTHCVGDITICVSLPGGAGLRKEDSPERSPRQGMKMTVHRKLKAHRRLKAYCSKLQL